MVWPTRAGAASAGGRTPTRPVVRPGARAALSPDMKCYVLTGSDDWAIRARRAQLLAEHQIGPSSVERFDVEDDGGQHLVAAAATFSLFGGTRLLDASPADALTAECARALAASATDVVIVLRGAKALTASVKKALGDDAQVQTFPIPTGRAVPARIVELAASHGVTLEDKARAVLVERGAHDLPRVAGALAQLASVGLTSPSAEQVERLMGTSAAPGVPWALSDALEAGDIAAALEIAETLEPVAVVAYLASRTGQLGRIVDDRLTDPDAIMSVLGLSSPFPARKLSKVAARLGSSGVAASWDLVAAADRSVKVAPDPRAALDLLVVELASLWGAGHAPAIRTR